MLKNVRCILRFVSSRKMIFKLNRNKGKGFWHSLCSFSILCSYDICYVGPGQQQYLNTPYLKYVVVTWRDKGAPPHHDSACFSPPCPGLRPQNDPSVMIHDWLFPPLKVPRLPLGPPPADQKTGLLCAGTFFCSNWLTYTFCIVFISFNDLQRFVCDGFLVLIHPFFCRLLC